MILIYVRLSHEWIYRHVAAGRARGGKLYKALNEFVEHKALGKALKAVGGLSMLGD